MGIRNNTLCSLVAAGGIALAGCASAPAAGTITADDRIALDFTCRLPNGEIAVTTSRQVTEDPSLKKSGIFLPRGSWETIVVTAGNPMPAGAAERPVFEDRVTDALAAKLPGSAPGAHSVRLSAELEATDAHNEPSTVKMERRQHRPLESAMPASEFQARTGAAPSPGKEIDFGDGVRAKVSAVAGDEVTLSYSVAADSFIQTPFGRGKVTQTPNDLEIWIDPQPGSLARTGPVLGTVVSVDEQTVTVDYGNPFGGQELSCDYQATPVAAAPSNGDLNANGK